MSKPLDSKLCLSPEQVTQWRREGYTIAPNFVDHVKGLAQLQEVYPPLGDGDTKPVQDFGSGGKSNFPNEKLTSINDMTVDEGLLTAVKQLLGNDDIVLIQSVAWAKYGIESSENDHSNRDQRVHMDYGNNMWVHPPPWDQPNAVSAIVYYSDVRETGGGTAVTARQGNDDELYQWPYQHMPGIGGHPFINDREKAEEMMKGRDEATWALRQKVYDREEQLAPTAGSVLFYRHDVWHRGTPVNVGKVRYVQNLAWCVRGAPGMNTWNAGLTYWMYYGWLEAFVRGLSGPQLLSLGFPPHSCPYWTEETKAAVSMRYGVDIYSRLKPE